MVIKVALLTLLAMLVGHSCQLWAQESTAVIGPVEHVYASPGGVDLKAYVFRSAAQIDVQNRSAMVIFHGGGWHIGSPEWAFGRARHFAERGMVAVAAQSPSANELPWELIDTLDPNHASWMEWLTRVPKLPLLPGEEAAGMKEPDRGDLR